MPQSRPRFAAGVQAARSPGTWSSGNPSCNESNFEACSFSPISCWRLPSRARLSNYGIHQMKGCFGPSHMGSGLADRRASKSEVSHTTDRREHARTAATFRRPTKAFQDGLAANPANVYLLTLDDVIASEGGIPIIADGKLRRRHGLQRRHRRAGRPGLPGGHRRVEVGQHCLWTVILRRSSLPLWKGRASKDDGRGRSSFEARRVQCFA